MPYKPASSSSVGTYINDDREGSTSKSVGRARDMAAKIHILVLTDYVYQDSTTLRVTYQVKSEKDSRNMTHCFIFKFLLINFKQVILTS